MQEYQENFGLVETEQRADSERVSRSSGPLQPFEYGRIEHLEPMLVHLSAMNSCLWDQFFGNTVLIMDQLKIWFEKAGIGATKKPELAQQRGVRQ
jgi:hypothetical protein